MQVLAETAVAGKYLRHLVRQCHVRVVPSTQIRQHLLGPRSFRRLFPKCLPYVSGLFSFFILYNSLLLCSACRFFPGPDDYTFLHQEFGWRHLSEHQSSDIGNRLYAFMTRRAVTR